MKLKITSSIGLPIPEAIVMLTDAPMPFNDIAAVADAGGIVDFSDQTIPGSYTVMVSQDSSQSTHTFDLHYADELVTIEL